MQTNKALLSMMSTQGRMDRLIMSGNRYCVSYDGCDRIPTATSGTIYNYKISDSCMGITGDHTEPGVNLKNPVEKENNALQAFACIRNRAKVISGDVKSKEGYVTGKHGGADHVMVYFDEETLEPMITEDKVLIRACGQGLKLMDHEEIQPMNIDPALFEGLRIVEEEQGIEILVVTCAPAYFTGSGLGGATTMLGDYNIMTWDVQADRKFGIDELHFGDLVMIRSHDSHNGPHYHRRAVSVGIAVHADSYTSGYGPGLAVIMSSWCGGIEPALDPSANIVNCLHTE